MKNRPFPSSRPAPGAPAIAVLVAVLAACGAAAAAAAAGFEREVAIEAEELQLENLIGEIRLEPADGALFEVHVAVQGKDADPELIAVEVVEGREARVTVRFPIEKHQDYVYPRLKGGSTTLRQPGQEKGGWFEQLLSVLTGEGIKVRGSGRGLEVWADVTVRVPSERGAGVALGVGRAIADGVQGDLVLDLRSGSVEVGRHRGRLVVDTGSGGVEIAGCTGPELLVDTGSGGVTVKGAETGKLLVDTGSGGVTVEDAETAELVIDTGSGGVRARAIGADQALIDTGSGSAVLELVRLGRGPVRIDTGSGGVRLALPAGVSAMIEAETGSGGISAEVPGGEVLQRSKNSLSMRVGDGSTKVTIDTGSGGVTITGK